MQSQGNLRKFLLRYKHLSSDDAGAGAVFEDEFLAALFESGTSGRMIILPSGLLKANEVLCKMLGYSGGELDNRHWHAITPVEDIEASQAHLEALAKGDETSINSGRRFIHKDGSVRQFNEHLSGIRASDNNLHFYLSSVDDITEDMNLSQTGIKTLQLYHALAEQASDAFFIHDFKGNILEVNQQACNSLGYSRDELLRMNVLDVEQDFDIKSAREQWDKIVPGMPFTIYGHQKRKDGTVFPAEVRFGCVIWENKKLFLGLARNITEQKKAEENLRVSEGRLRLFAEHAPASLAMFDREMRYMAFSNRWLKDYYLESSDIIGKSHYEIFPEIGEDWKNVHQRAMQGEVVQREEDKFVRFDGRVQWLRWEVRPWLNSEGKVGGIVVFTEDITLRKQAEEALRESEEKYRRLFETMTTGIIYQGEDGKVLSANPAAERILGLSLEQLRGEVKIDPSWHMIKEDDTPVSDDEYPAIIALKTKKAVTPRTLGVCIPGSKRVVWLVVSATPLFLPGQAHPHQVYSIMEDITDRREAEVALKEREEVYRTLVENMSEGMVLSDTEGKILFVNQRLCEIFGYTAEEITGQRGTRLLEFPDEIYHNPVIDENIANGLKGSIDVRGITKAGKKIWLQINYAPYRSADGTIIGTVDIVKDITHEKQAQEELLQKRDLEKQMAIANQSLQFKQNFLANMSHEIRTPLSAILGVADILARTTLDSFQQEYLQILQVAGENLTGIINDVLDFSKIEAGKLELKKKPFRLKDMLMNAESLFRNLVKRDVEFELDIAPEIPDYVEADPVRINQVINNLLSNAVKFTREGKITLKGELLSRNKADNSVEIKISVSDTGIGISQSQQQRLFNRFFQAEENDLRKTEGTGLGLSISKNLVDMHGGQMGVESEVGKGSTFWFTLVVKEVNEKDIVSGVKNTISELPFRPLDILLVEDNLVNQKVFSITLKYLGNMVALAANGQEAIDKIESHKFDLVLMDIQMPVMDGITATRILREKYTDLPPIVGLSANAFEGDKEKYVSQGLDEYLTKPLKIDEFLAVVKKVVV